MVSRFKHMKKIASCCEEAGFRSFPKSSDTSDSSSKILQPRWQLCLRFSDTSFDVQGNPNSVMYVDKEAPGYDCTATAPTGWKRLTEVVLLFLNSVTPRFLVDTNQGCFNLAMSRMCALDQEVAHLSIVTRALRK